MKIERWVKDSIMRRTDGYGDEEEAAGKERSVLTLSKSNDGPIGWCRGVRVR